METLKNLYGSSGPVRLGFWTVGGLLVGIGAALLPIWIWAVIGIGAGLYEGSRNYSQ